MADFFKILLIVSRFNKGSTVCFQEVFQMSFLCFNLSKQSKTVKGVQSNFPATRMRASASFKRRPVRGSTPIRSKGAGRSLGNTLRFLRDSSPTFCPHKEPEGVELPRSTSTLF